MRRDKLERLLNHTNFPCPAQGLDLILITKKNAEEIKPEPIFEFWFSSGEQWPKESWEKGSSAEMLIFIELVQDKGIKIYGDNQSIEFKRVERKLILNAFKEILSWHKNCILDGYHDPNGQNSVLNACRIMRFIETSKLYSKSEGGKQFLKHNPNYLVVQKVLRSRQNEGLQKITKKEILELIEYMEIELDRAM